MTWHVRLTSKIRGGINKSKYPATNSQPSSKLSLKGDLEVFNVREEAEREINSQARSTTCCNDPNRIVVKRQLSSALGNGYGKDWADTIEEFL